MAEIYVPKGKALEYGELAVNLYAGCDHRCSYCYAPAVTRTEKDVFAAATPRKDIIKKIRKEIHKHVGKQIFLCFTCDPYCKKEQETQLTRQAIKAIHEGGAFVNILTKGGMRSTRDFDLLGEGDSYGATLTFYEHRNGLQMEPGASLPYQRIDALEQAKLMGLNTWVSLEPVIIPWQTLQLVKETQTFVDHYKVGKWNHDQRANKIDWAYFLVDVESMLRHYGKDFYIKADLEAYRGKSNANRT